MARKYVFKLKIDPLKVENRFSFGTYQPPPVVKNTIKLDEIPKITAPDFVNFVDNTSCSISIPDKKCCCFWCHHPVGNPNHLGIGCPVNYVSDVISKTYYSEISKDNFSIRENIPRSKLEQFKNCIDKRIIIDQKGYYETYGYFCSFNCCMAFVIDNRSNPVFRNSKFLLLSVYSKFTGLNKEIEPAPDWRTLRDYGGTLTIEEFRSAFNNMRFKDMGTYVRQFPIGTLFTKTIRV